MDFSTIVGWVSAFQNGMTLENPMKIERFIALRLRSGVFALIIAKTLGGYLGHLKAFFGATKSIEGCPLMVTSRF